jgi:hypothetical protein
MPWLSVVLWAAGIVLVLVGALRANAVWTRLSALDALADNARRYEGWRGGRSSATASEGTTGADVMRDLLRRRLYLWGGIALVGVALVLAGFAIR